MATEKEEVQLSISAVLDGGSINELTKTLTSGVEDATSEGGKRAQKQYAEHIKLAMLTGVAGATEDRTVKKFTKQLVRAEEMQKAIVAAYDRGDKEYAKSLERRRKKEMKMMDQLHQRREKNFEEFSRLQSRHYSEVAEDFSQKMQSGLGDLLSGNVDVGGIIKKFGQRAQRAGDATAERSRMADASKMEKMMGGVGKLVAGMGGAIMAIGAVAAMVVALVKAFIDLDQKIKDMNKSIAETAGAADFGFGTAGQAAVGMSATLETIRGQILEQASDWKGYRQSSESMFQVLQGMNEMNFTFKQMQDEIKNTNNQISSFADISIRAVAYGKLLGVSSQEMGQNMAKMANEFGVGLDVISEGLHLVHKEALLSGFSTKRFYSTILEVTSGLGLYNVRLTEAAGLLSGMGAALGETRGEALFKDVAGGAMGAAEKSPVDALRDILISGGPDKVKDIFADEAAAKAGQMFEALKNRPEVLESLGKMFKLDTSSAQAFGESFAKAAPSAEKWTKALADLEVRGEARGFGVSAQRLAKGGTGDIDRMAASYGELGAAGQLRFMMRLPAMFGKSFDDLSELLAKGQIPELQAFLDARGMSMKQLKEMADLQDSLADEFRAMRKKAKADGLGEGDIMERGEFGRFKILAGGQFQKVDDEGRAIGAAFKDVDSYLDAQNDFIAQRTRTIDEDLELGKQIAKNTEGLNQVIQENVAAILNKIYSTLMDIWHWISGDADKRRQMKVIRVQFERNIAGQRKEAETAMEKASLKLQTAQAKGDKEGAATASAALEDATNRRDMLDAVARAAPSVNPEEYDNIADYTEAVYLAAGLTKADMPDIGTGQVGPKVGGGPESPKHAKRVGRLQELFQEGRDDDVSNIMQGWNTLDRIIRKEVVDGTSGAVRDQWEDVLAFIQEQYRMNGEGLEADWWGAGTYDVTHLNDYAIGAIMDAVNDPQAALWGQAKGAKAAWGASNPGLADVAAGALGHQMPGQGFPMQKMNDMYVPSGGRPVMLNSADSVLAMMKGGAVDRAMGRGGGGGVTIIVKNYGNPREVQDAVVRGIKIARGEPFV